MKIPPFLLLGALLVAAPARADTCAGLNQMDMNACAAHAFETADARLNTTYRDIMSRLKDDAALKDLLTKAQREWIQFRDSECAFSSSGVQGGSIYPTVLQNCRAQLTSDRAKALGVYLICQEGDLACPVPRQ
jgi:uncharacterized protein YecT (DUF1311 family)